MSGDVVTSACRLADSNNASAARRWAADGGSSGGPLGPVGVRPRSLEHPALASRPAQNAMSRRCRDNGQLLLAGSPFGSPTTGDAEWPIARQRIRSALEGLSNVAHESRASEVFEQRVFDRHDGQPNRASRNQSHIPSRVDASRSRFLRGWHSREASGTLLLSTDLNAVEQAIGRLTAAIAAGGELAPLVEALRVHERRRQELRAALDAARRTRPDWNPRELRRTIERYLVDWRGLLRANVAQGQQALRRLIAGRLTFTPTGDIYAFRGVGTIKPVLGGVVHRLASPRGPGRFHTLRSATRRLAA